MSRIIVTIKIFFIRMFSRRNLPESINCLKRYKNLYQSLYFAQQFSDPVMTLKYALNQASPSGIALEFGVYSGKTLSTIAQKFPGQTFGFDSFDGLPEYWRDGFPEGKFKVDIKPFIQGAEIIEGLFQDSLEPFLQGLTSKISFIHLDADLYSSTKYVLTELNYLIEPNCIILFDEFMNYPGFESHEFLAFSEWCDEGSRICNPITFTDCHEQMGFVVVQ
jgi:hypothetical protein